MVQLHGKPETGDRHVTILMALFNGARNLTPQLESLEAQTHRSWSLVVSDDGSSDAGPAMIREFGAQVGALGRSVEIIGGPRAGFAQNFLHLLRHDPAPRGYVALCDQDDVWLPGKLTRGLAALKDVPEEVPTLYCSRTWITDADLKQRRLSTAWPREPGFRNALVQNIAAGNTIMLNPSAARLIAAAARDTGQIVAHDWWIYQIITGAGGRVIHDTEPTLLYRQHGSNLIGANDSWAARMVRIGMILSGEYRDWSDINIGALRPVLQHFTPENRRIFEDFVEMRQTRFAARLRSFSALGLYRQTRASTAALWVATLLRRL